MAWSTLESSVKAAVALMLVLAEKSADNGLQILTSQTIAKLNQDFSTFGTAFNAPATASVNAEVAS